MRHKYLAVVALLFAFLPLHAQDIASFEKRVQVRTLPNGLTVVLMRRAEAPVFSFYTIVDAGSAQDPKGATGLAHMFEHMAFKGTENIGTTDYASEKVVLAKIEQAYAEKRAGPGVKAAELIAQERAKRLSTIDADAAAEQARVEQLEKEYDAKMQAEADAAEAAKSGDTQGNQ